MKHLEQFAVDSVGSATNSVLRLFQEEARQPSAPADSAEILTHLGEAYRRMGRFDDALKTYSTGLHLWSKLGVENRSCWCLWGIGATLRVRGRFQHCLVWLHTAAQVAYSCGEQRCYLWAHAEIAETMRITGERQRCLGDHLALLEEFRQIHDSKGICWAALGIGQIYRMELHYREAGTWFQKGLVEAESSGDLVNAGYALRGLAEIAKDTGDPGMARHLAELALDKFRKKGYPTGQAYTTKTLADIAAKCGLLDDAENHAADALLQFRQIGKPRGIAFALRSYAEIQALIGSTQAAWSASRQAAVIFDGISVRNLSLFDPNRLIQRLNIAFTFRHTASRADLISVPYEQDYHSQIIRAA